MSSSEEEEFDGNLEDGEVEDGEEEEEDEEDEEEHQEEEEEDDDGDNDNDDDVDVDGQGGTDVYGGISNDVDDDGDDDDDDEDQPLSSLAASPESNNKKRSASSKVSSYAENDDDDDDDDDDYDIPLAQLGSSKNGKKKETKNIKNSSSTKKKPEIKKKPTETKKAALTPAKNKKKKLNGSSSTSRSPAVAAKTTTTTGSSASKSNITSTNKTFEWISAAFYGTECEKGLLIQRLLCRWWYAYTWPDPALIPKKPPIGYDSLDGFPGVYVCTSGESSKIGQIMDVRNHEDCPSFRTYVKKSVTELKTMLRTALEKQKEQLIENDGPGTSTEKEIDTLLKWTNRINPEKAEREAANVLKANKLFIK